MRHLLVSPAGNEPYQFFDDMDGLALVHEMAAVAWDRDCAEIGLKVPVATTNLDGVDMAPKAVVRCVIMPDSTARLYTGRPGNQVATWCPHTIRWVPMGFL